jgi:hypothetical protein
MDILLFKKKTADESLAFAKSDGWRFYRSLERYAASFYTDPEYAFEVFGGLDISRQRVADSPQAVC